MPFNKDESQTNIYPETDAKHITWQRIIKMKTAGVKRLQVMDGYANGVSYMNMVIFVSYGVRFGVFNSLIGIIKV